MHEKLMQRKACVQADGSLRPTSVEAEALLREALALDDGQALALHLHVHLSEAASPLRCVRQRCGLSYDMLARHLLPHSLDSIM